MVFTTQNQNKKTGKKAYKLEFLSHGFVVDDKDVDKPVCLVCFNSFSNSFMRVSKMKEHMERKHSGYINKDIKYWESMAKKSPKSRLNLQTLFQTCDDTKIFKSLSLEIAVKTAQKAYPYSLP